MAAGWIRGIPQSEACHLAERFTRVDADTIQYEATIGDPKVCTRPCHEANYALGNMLRLGSIQFRGPSITDDEVSKKDFRE